MFMYPFRKLSAHADRILKVQFALAFKVRALTGWINSLAVMTSDRNNPERSSGER